MSRPKEKVHIPFLTPWIDFVGQASKVSQTIAIDPVLLATGLSWTMLCRVQCKQNSAIINRCLKTASENKKIQGGKANFSGSIFIEYLTQFQSWDHQTSYSNSLNPSRAENVQNLWPSLNPASVEVKIQLLLES